MDLGFIESKTYEEIRVGDKASTEHVLTSEDAMAFASISGFHSVLRSDELIARGGFGSPTIFVGGDDMFFGNDRLPLVRAAVLRLRG